MTGCLGSCSATTITNVSCRGSNSPYYVLFSFKYLTFCYTKNLVMGKKKTYLTCNAKLHFFVSTTEILAV